jgi:hypothetical protein
LGMAGGQPEVPRLMGRAEPAAATSTSQLMYRASAGEGEAWNDLVDRLAPSVWRAVRACGLGGDDEARLWQVVWARLADNLPVLRSDQVDRWLQRVTLREAQRLVRLEGA